MKINKLIFLLLTICMLSVACKNEIKFDKTGWTTTSDIGIYPNRDKMLNDLTQHYKLKGLTYRQLIEQLGKPENNMIGNSNAIYYNIITDYGHNIDPVYTKSLQFNFDKDSIITDFRIHETKR